MTNEPPHRAKPTNRSPEGTARSLSTTEIGARVKAARRRANLTQTKLAEALGVTFQQVQKYEKGINRIPAANLAKIAAALDVPAGYLMGDSGEPYRDPLEGLITMDSIRLLHAFGRLDPETRTTILNLAERLAAWD